MGAKRGAGGEFVLVKGGRGVSSWELRGGQRGEFVGAKRGAGGEFVLVKGVRGVSSWGGAKRGAGG